MGTFGADANGEATSGMNHKGESTNAAPRGGTLRSSDEVGESRRSEGGVCSEATSVGPTRKGRSLKDEAKPFCISRWEVWEAYLKVKSNQGAAGLDGQTIEEFERDLKKNLYRIWNRMSSGSYFPPPVRTVKIPKANGGERTLGIPTVSDRIAQMVVKNRLEAVVDPLFLPASYGYRPNKSALDAVGQARQMCWAYDWVCDLDIKGFFDNLDHDLMMKAVRKHAQERWMELYIERWLKAPAQDEEGRLLKRERGHSARRSDQPPAGQSVSALRVRRVDGPELVSSAVRAVRGRYYRPLQNRAGSEPGACQNSGTVEAVWVGTASGEDESGLLQGCQSAGELTRTRSSIFWGSRFGLGRRTVGKERPFVVSVQPCRRKRSRKSGMRSAGGSCIAVRGNPFKRLPG